jgi:hypothetical protein
VLRGDIKFEFNGIDWELEKKHRQLGLNNDIDLKFTLNGEFIRDNN